MKLMSKFHFLCRNIQSLISFPGSSRLKSFQIEACKMGSKKIVFVIYLTLLNLFRSFDALKCNLDAKNIHSQQKPNGKSCRSLILSSAPARFHPPNVITLIRPAPKKKDKISFSNHSRIIFHERKNHSSLENAILSLGAGRCVFLCDCRDKLGWARFTVWSVSCLCAGHPATRSQWYVHFTAPKLCQLDWHPFRKGYATAQTDIQHDIDKQAKVEQYSTNRPL